MPRTPALEWLQEDPLIEGELYPGDLLGLVTGLEPGYWRDRPDLREAVEEIVRRSTPLPKHLEDRPAAFKGLGFVMDDKPSRIIPNTYRS